MTAVTGYLRLREWGERATIVAKEYLPSVAETIKCHSLRLKGREWLNIL